MIAPNDQQRREALSGSRNSAEGPVGRTLDGFMRRFDQLLGRYVQDSVEAGQGTGEENETIQDRLRGVNGEVRQLLAEAGGTLDPREYRALKAAVQQRIEHLREARGIDVRRGETRQKIADAIRGVTGTAADSVDAVTNEVKHLGLKTVGHGSELTVGGLAEFLKGAGRGLMRFFK